MTKQHPAWSPYDNNGGTCVAIAGADYCVIAADTRMSTGYSILTRDYSKICKLADKCVMASSGFQADVKALQKLLAARHLIYQHQHNKQMSCPGMAQLLSNTLYYKRFFPYYSFNVLGGLDNEGKGCVYTYDAVGSYERVGYSSQGSGSTLIMPFLDNQLKSPSPLLLPAQDAVTPLSEAEAVDLFDMSFLASGYVAVMMPIGEISFFYSNIRSGVIVVEDKLYICAPVSVKDCKFQASDMAIIL
ncbi:proteasome subunit beta type-1 [Citrus sinensis]|uniref:Proteasome subunit beta type-1 n=1 Tax=Citrus sinensis TaxID=2711 RepID=A0ACB8MSA8_CITSI|nr:proteasome subunit beta type-1 [Citrus sinensis]